MSVVMFVFAGRRANMELQLPFMYRILDENPDVEYHVWNLCRDPADVDFLHAIQGERVIVRDDYYGKPQGCGWNNVYRHYADPAYAKCLFVKLDDDVVFLETQRFPDFISAVEENPGVFISANIVNNGACTAHIPGLQERFVTLNVPLLDVHESNLYGNLAHSHFLQYSDQILDQPVELVDTEDWLSINVIGYDWATGRRLAARLGQPQAGIIAGRGFGPTSRLGDEGRVNMFKRRILRGFTAGHLTFGPQRPTDAQLLSWRRGYAELSQCYLSQRPRRDLAGQP